jgi:hypothetical protein
MSAPIRKVKSKPKSKPTQTEPTQLDSAMEVITSQYHRLSDQAKEIYCLQQDIDELCRRMEIQRSQIQIQHAEIARQRALVPKVPDYVDEFIKAMDKLEDATCQL